MNTRSEPKQPPNWKVGDVIDGIYRVEKIPDWQLNPMYVVTHVECNKKLVAKLPSEFILSNSEIISYFTSEGLLRLEMGAHPNIVSCYSIKQIEHVPCIFLEYMDGGRLRDWIWEGRCIDYRTNLNLAIQFCHGMEFIHSKGIIHSDLKPENVLMTKEGILKINDFNTARRSLKKKLLIENPLFKKDKLIGGTAGYMSPEHFNDPQNIDERSDIFSFGLCLYEMFCGNKPYDISYGKPQEAPDPVVLSKDKKIPLKLAKILMKCIQWDPEERFYSFEEIREGLSLIYFDLFKEESSYAKLELVGLEANGLNNQGVAYFEIGRKEDAIRCWKKALKREPLHLEATFNCLLVEWRNGEITDTEVLRLIDNCANNPSVDKEKLAELKACIHTERYAHDDARNALKQFPGKYKDLFSIKVIDQIRYIRTLVINKSFLSFSITPDGCYVVTGYRDVHVWNLETGQCVRTMEGHSDKVTSVANTPGSHYALSGSLDKTLRLWDLETGQCIHIMEGHKDQVWSISVTPDGRFAVSGSADKTVRLWDLETGQCIRTMDGHTDPVRSVAITPNGRYAVSGSADKTVRLWNLETGQCIYTMKGHTAPVSSVVITPNGRYVLSGSYDDTIRLWNLETGQCIRTMEGHMDPRSVAITLNGRYAISVSPHSILRLWDIETGQCMRTMKGPRGELPLIAITFDGKHMVWGYDMKYLGIWTIPFNKSYRSKLEVSKIKGFNEIKIEKDTFNKIIGKAENLYNNKDYKGSFSRLYEAWENTQYANNTAILDLYSRLMQKGKAKGQVFSFEKKMQKGHTQRVVTATLTPDGTFAVSGSADKTVRLWDLDTGQCIRTMEGHTDDVWSVTVTLDGKFAVSGSKDNTIRLWELETGRCVQTIERHTKCTRSLYISPDGRFAVSHYHDKNLRVYDLKNNKCISTLEGHTDTVSSVSITLDSRYVVSSSYDNTIRLWELETGRCVRTMGGHTNGVVLVKVTPDDRFAVSITGDNIYRLWELKTGQCIRAIMKWHRKDIMSRAITPDCKHAVWITEGGLWLNIGRRDGPKATSLSILQLETGLLQFSNNYFNEFSSLIFTPDSRYAISDGADNTILVFELETGRCVHEMKGHVDKVCSVVIDPNGKHVVLGKYVNTIRVWELVWDLEFPDPVDWDEGVRPYLDIFLTLRNGKWTEDDFNKLINELATQRGYGWVKPKGIRRELEKMTTKYKD